MHTAKRYIERVIVIAGGMILAALAAPCGCGAPETGRNGESTEENRDRREDRLEMVAVIRNRYAFSDQRVLEAMKKVPRHRFIPATYRWRSDPYGDHPCPIGHGQTISQPYIVAYMTSLLEIEGGETVLEIGTGSGYQAAVLAEMGAAVYTIEIVPELAEHARTALADEGYENVHVKTGDGYKGWPRRAPFDAVIVTCAPEDIPAPLVAQLGEGGRMIIPVGDRGSQRLILLKKEGGDVKKEDDLRVRFVPMVKGDDSAGDAID